MDRIRVFLLDDHEVVRRGLRDLLEAGGDIEVVGESGSAVEAQRRIPALRPHVAVLDARLPDGSGIDVCREVRSRDATISCLILTSFDDDEALLNAIMAGAAGYVLKQIRGTDLLDAVRRVAAGQSGSDGDRTGDDPAAAGTASRSSAGRAHRAGKAHPRPHRPGHDEPANR